MPEKHLRLMDICPTCKKKDVCFYRSKHWHACEYVKQIVDNILGERW